ncbi:MAG TPA: DNA repair exonuclease, partial [Firmicutes bacterium]|nr:DNA repair exonuclease [Bacillota bacterium]
MIRCLHLADLHLGWEPSFLGPRAAHRQRERDDLLRRIVDYALANGVDLVIIAGDLFETHRPPADLADAVRRDLRRLDQAGVAVVTVPGNHDEITYHDSVYRQGDWPGVLVQNPTVDKVATLSIKGQDCHFYSLAYTGGLTPSDPLTEFPRSDEQGFHIAVFHGTLDWNPGERSLPLQSAALAAANYHYTALGHIHRHSVHRSGPGGPLVYAGAVEGKGFHDLGTGQL